MYSASTSFDLRELPPSKNALELHIILRSAFQAGWIWGNTLSQRPTPTKLDWGWQLHTSQNRVMVQWYIKPAVSDIKLSDVTSTCKCNGIKSTCSTCTCGKQNMVCLNSCVCKRNCITTKRLMNNPWSEILLFVVVWIFPGKHFLLYTMQHSSVLNCI